MSFALFNDIKRIIRSPRLEEEGVTTLFGDVKLDLTKAPLLPGDHRLRLISLFGDIKLRVPEHIGIDIDAAILFGELEVETLATDEEEQPGASWQSDNFGQASVRIHIQVQSLFGDIEVVRVPSMTEPPLALREASSAPERTTSYEGETSKLYRD